MQFIKEVHEGDIVLAPFHFAENNEAKLRPCLVWSMTPVSVTLVFITSKKLSKDFPTEVLLNEKNAALLGLHQPGRIDFGKRDRCLPHDIVKVIGNIAALPRASMKECADAAAAAFLLEE